MAKQRKGKVGRPKEPVVRETQVTFFLTNHDAGWLKDFASEYGFKSRSEVVTFVLERLIAGGFSGLSALKMSMVLHEHCKQVNPDKMRQAGFAWGEFRPASKIPDELLTTDQRVLLSDIAAKLQRKGLA